MQLKVAPISVRPLHLSVVRVVVYYTFLSLSFTFWSSCQPPRLPIVPSPILTHAIRFYLPLLSTCYYYTLKTCFCSVLRLLEMFLASPHRGSRLNTIEDAMNLVGPVEVVCVKKSYYMCQKKNYSTYSWTITGLWRLTNVDPRALQPLQQEALTGDDQYGYP
jgi:hypothetical protein